MGKNGSFMVLFHFCGDVLGFYTSFNGFSFFYCDSLGFYGILSMVFLDFLLYSSW